MVKKINEAFCVKTGKIMSINDITRYSNYSEIQNHLYCTTTDCTAKLNFAFSKKGNYLRTFRLQNHLPTCVNAFDRESGSATIIYAGTVSGRMSEKESRNKLKYAFDKFLKNDDNSDDDVIKKTPTKRRVVQTVDPKLKKRTPVTKVLLDENSNTENTYDLETLKSIYGKISVEKYSAKELNQIINSDTNKKLNLTTYASSMRKLKNTYEIILEHKNRKGVLVLTESFLKNNSDVQFEEYLDNLMVYLNTDSDHRFPVVLFSLCRLRTFSEDEELIFYLTEFDYFGGLTVLNNKPQLLSLPLFNLSYTKGNFNKN